jgi:galactonate dehydratase
VKITSVETFVVDAGWKNWVFARVHTDEGITGVGEGTLNGFARTIATAIAELEHLAIGEDPRRVTRLSRRLLEFPSNDGGHIHRSAAAAIEIACWDILGKSVDLPIYGLLGGAVRDEVLSYANGWYRTERTPEAFADAADHVLSLGLRALKVDPFGCASAYMSEAELDVSYSIVHAIRERVGTDVAILIDAHARFTEGEAVRAANRLAPLNIFWFEEPSSREREGSASNVGRRASVRIATGETFHMLGQFFGLAASGGVDIYQPEPMSLGGIGTTLAVAHLADAAGAWIAPHQSGGPIATAVCLQLAAAIPNFLIQEHFDPFNVPWTSELVTWTPTINAATGSISIPTGPGLGVDLVDEIAHSHPYNPQAYLNIHLDGWELRIGQ